MRVSRQTIDAGNDVAELFASPAQLGQCLVLLALVSGQERIWQHSRHACHFHAADKHVQFEQDANRHLRTFDEVQPDQAPLPQVACAHSHRINRTQVQLAPIVEIVHSSRFQRPVAQFVCLFLFLQDILHSKHDPPTHGNCSLSPAFVMRLCSASPPPVPAQPTKRESRGNVVELEARHNLTEHLGVVHNEDVWIYVVTDVLLKGQQHRPFVLERL